MTLELLYTGFPLIHNASSWSEFGYFYKENNIMDGQELVPQRVNQNLYNVFSICQDFRQRLVQYQLLSEKAGEPSLPEINK